MQLARIYAVLTAVLIFSACADIVPLTGGPTDEVAPKPVKISPLSGETNIQPNQVTIVFDEYVVLKEPETTISMRPEVGALKAELNKRTLTVSWDQALAPETTYILNINGAIRDLNESNDSIFQIVFSTGQFIDSLTHSGNITSAYSGERIQNATVCLFAKDSVPFLNKATYLTRSDKNGDYLFSYIKSGEYSLFAFQDQNKNQSPDPTENIAFETEKINVTDTLQSALRMFKPRQTVNKLKVSIDKPGIVVASGIDFRNTPLFVNGQATEIIDELRFDSLRTNLPSAEEGRYVFIAGTDTLIRLLTVKDRAANFAVKLKSSKQWRPGDTLLFVSNEYYKTTNEANITVLSAANKPLTYKQEIRNGKLYIVPNTTENFSVHFNKYAITGNANSNDTITYSFETYIPEKCGNILLDVTDFDDTWVFELVNNINTENGTVVARKNGNSDKLLFTNLIPGQYSIRCFHDENGNGIWDSGDYSKSLQPETMRRYTIPQKVRANWDIEEKLAF